MDTASSWLGRRASRRGEERLGDGYEAGAHDLEDRVPVDGGARFLDGVPEALEHVGDVHRRGGHLGIDRRARPRLGRHGDPQPPGIGAHLARVRTRRRRREVLLADRGPVDGVEEVGGVADGAGEPEGSLSPNSGSPTSGPDGTRPRLGLSPTSPQQDAGIRIEPAPSLPCAIGTAPAATSAAAPPLDPPTPRSRSHGLRVGPVRRGSVAKLIANSGTW